MSNIKFGITSEDSEFSVTSFYFDIRTFCFHITIEYNMYVEQLVLSYYEVEKIGLIDLNKLKSFTDTIKKKCKK